MGADATSICQSAPPKDGFVVPFDKLTISNDDEMKDLTGI